METSARALNGDSSLRVPAPPLIRYCSLSPSLFVAWVLGFSSKGYGVFFYPHLQLDYKNPRNLNGVSFVGGAVRS